MANFNEDEAKQLLDAFSSLGVKPKADDPESLRQWMEDYVVAQGRQRVEAAQPQEATVRHQTHVTQFPKLVPFSGDTSKPDAVTYDLWRYDVQCLIEEDIHSKESIKQALRNSLRGEAGRIVMRLGPKATIDVIMSKLDGVYGIVEPSETLLSEFYSAQQRHNEDVTSWSCRLEDILTKAMSKGQIDQRAADEMLRTKFWTGLCQRLKDSSRHKFDSIKDFDRLRVEIRAIEHEFRVSESQAKADSHQVKMAQAPVDLQETLLQLRDEMKSMKKDMQEMKLQIQKGQQRPTSAPTSYKSTPSAKSTLECWKCHKKGHVKKNCFSKTDDKGNPLNP